MTMENANWNDQNLNRRSFLAGVGSLALAAVMLPATAQASELVAQTANLKTVEVQAKKKKSAVICFSCTGTTLGVAKRIQKATGATLVRVKAKRPYTEGDLDWTDDESRSVREHESASTPAKSKVRPAISNLAAIRKAVKAADVVYVGYPIWWGEAPHIVYTLIESVSLKGKTVVPFCTSMSSGLGSSAAHLKARAKISKKTAWKKGKNYYGIPSQKSVTKWLSGLKLV